MATAAGEGITTTDAYEGVGAGGKFRKRPFRRTQTTPYDRPPTALRNPSTSRTGWLSKLVVDPASKIISASARHFFSSVLRKPLTPPPPPPGANQESSNRLQEAVPNNYDGAQQSAIGECGNQTVCFDGSGISELEQFLKQKTFTQSEIDRLTELLRSRTVDLPAADEVKRTDTNLSQPVSNLARHKEFAITPMEEDMIQRDRCHGIISTPVASSRDLKEDVASPAELAKAYMGSRPSKASPSMLGMRGQAPREDANFLNNTSFPSKSSIMSLTPNTAVRAISGNAFTTPRSRGRSAIYSMARTPYSKVHQTASQKGTGSTNFGYGGPLATSASSPYALEHGGQFGSNQAVQKRRSSVLDDDIGSVGPMRRIRQKSNLVSQASALSTRGMLVGSSAAGNPISSRQKLLLVNESKHKVSTTMVENVDSYVPSTSYAHVPSKSSEVATKILQQLEKLTPKEKSSESKLVALREKSPIKLTPNMLRGQALRSLEDVDSSKLMQNDQDHHKRDSSVAYLLDARDSTAQKQDKVEENGSEKFVVPRDMSTPPVNGDITVSVKDTVPYVKNANAIITSSSMQPHKKRAFQMSAHEDSLDLDDDVHSDGPASTLLAEGRREVETSVGKSETLSTEAAALDKSPTLPEAKIPSSLVSEEITVLGAPNGSVNGEKTTGVTLPNSHAPSFTFQQTALTQSTSGFFKTAPIKEANAPPLFSISSDKLQPFTFSSSTFNELAGPKSSAWSDPKAESSNSLSNVIFGATDAQLEIPKSDKSDNTSTQKSGDIIGKSEILPSALSPSASTSSIFSFGASTNNSNLNNGSVASSPPNVSSTFSVLASSNSAIQNFINSSTQIASSTSIATMTTTGTTSSTSSPFNTSLPITTAAPSFPATPIFKFGSSDAPISGAETTDLKAKSEKETTFGSLTSSPFGGTSFAMASTGSSIFGFSSSVTASTAQNQSQPSPFGVGTGSLVSTQVSPAGSEVATVTQSMPTQFGSSASSPVFGTSGSSALTSSSSLFGSSTPASKLFGSATAFGLGSSVSSSETNSISSSSGATSSIFSFGLSSSAPSLLTNSVSSSSGATSSKFGFDQSSSASSSQINSISSSSGATSSIFGSTWQPTNSPIFGSKFNSQSPSTGFTFGASSSSVATSNSAPMVFGSSTDSSSNSLFSFTTANSTTSSMPFLSQTQPVFGNSTTVFTASANSDQMNMEDSMAEDPVQASTPTAPIFGQPSTAAPPAGSMFGSAAPSPAVPFQFVVQQNQATLQNPFQASSSLELSGSGGFSLGSAGNDKSNRKIVKVNRNRMRRK